MRGSRGEQPPGGARRSGDLRAHKRARSGGFEAASRVHNALRLRDVQTVVGIVHTRLPSIGDGHDVAVKHKPGASTPFRI